MADKKGFDEETIARELADFPLNGIERSAADEDLEELMKERGMASNKTRDRRLAHDAAIERRFYDLFPDAKRLRPKNALEVSYGEKIATDGAGISDGYQYFPEARRISLAPGRSN